MKKIVSIVVLMYLMCFTAYAGDLPEAVITMPDMDVFIGEIVETDSGKVKIDVHYALFGCYDVDTVTVDEFRYFGHGEDGVGVPEEGDYVAIAAEYKDGRWAIAFESNSGLAAQADSTDPETLKLSGSAEGEGGMLERMNRYINDGTYSYERRKELMGAVKNAAGEVPFEVSDGTSNDSAIEIPQNAQNIAADIAAKTEIVLLPPITTDSSASQNPSNAIDMMAYWYNKPFIKYPFITLFSALISYAFTKRITCRIEGKER